jgi:hypothetical protein
MEIEKKYIMRVSRSTLFLFLLVRLISPIQAQSADKLTSEKVTPIDPNRYEEVKGSPMLFEDFVAANVYEFNDPIIAESLNYNGYTQEFEAINKGIHTVLEDKYYTKFEFISTHYNRFYDDFMSDTTLFVRGLNPENSNKFYVLIYSSDDYVIFKDFKIQLNKRVVESPGKTIDFNEFNPFFNYWILRDGKKLSLLKLNKKALLDVLGESKELSAFIKENKLSVKTEAELKEVMKFHASMAN